MTNQVTPTLQSLLQLSVKNALKEVHTSMPACVESYDREKQICSVVPCLKRVYSDGREVTLPLISNVPVCFQGSNDVHIHFDLKKGDEVLLVFSERSIDKWIVNGGTLASGDRRMFDLSDAIAIPGLRAIGNSFSPNSEVGSLEISNGKSFLEVTNSGKWVIQNEKNELFSVLVELIDKMIEGKNLTTGGPLPKDPEYIAALNGIKEKLESFVK